MQMGDHLNVETHHGSMSWMTWWTLEASNRRLLSPGAPKSEASASTTTTVGHLW